MGKAICYPINITFKKVVSIKGICYIIAACKENLDNFYISPSENDIIIAADGGYDILKEKNINPNIIIGDFDSITTDIPCENVIKHPVEKDETDTFLALKSGFDKGFSNFVIFGGVGGRIDHTLANIQTLLWTSKRGGRAFLIGDGVVMTVIFNEKLSFSSDIEGTVSIFAQEAIAKGVKISGLKYSAENITLSEDFPLGISNEFVGERAEISVQEGSLLIIWEQKREDFIKNLLDFTI